MACAMARKVSLLLSNDLLPLKPTILLKPKKKKNITLLFFVLQIT
jgi:hypothetical protein